MHLSPRHRYIPSIPFYTIRQGWRGEDYGAENDLSETSIEEVWRPGRNFGRVQYFRIRGGGVSRHAMPGPGHAATSRNLYTWFVASPPPPAPDQINSLRSIFYRFPRTIPRSTCTCCITMLTWYREILTTGFPQTLRIQFPRRDGYLIWNLQRYHPVHATVHDGLLLRSS